MSKLLLLLVFAAIAMVSGGAFMIAHAPAIVWAITYAVDGALWLLAWIEKRKNS